MTERLQVQPELPASKRLGNDLSLLFPGSRPRSRMHRSRSAFATSISTR